VHKLKTNICYEEVYDQGTHIWYNVVEMTRVIDDLLKGIQSDKEGLFYEIMKQRVRKEKQTDFCSLILIFLIITTGL
jgi:hypothetical protein